jgi:hypothetical protein
LTKENKILKINRHLFYSWDLQIKQGIAAQSPKGFDSPFTLDVKLWIASDLESVNEKMKIGAVMLKPNLCLQKEGYRSDSFSGLNFFSHPFGVLHLFIFQNLNSTYYGFI